MTLDAILQSQILRIRLRLREPYQPMTSRPVKRAQVARRIPSDVHGTRSGYKAYGCRCVPCKAAVAEYSSRMRQQQRERARAAAPQMTFFPQQGAIHAQA